MSEELAAVVPGLIGQTQPTRGQNGALTGAGLENGSPPATPDRDNGSEGQEE